MDITVKNYRSFSDEHPLRINVQDGVIALVGPNNTGKSNVLKFFYELRSLFSELRNVAFYINGGRFTTHFQGVMNQEEPFNKFNDKKIEIIFSFKNTETQVSIIRSNRHSNVTSFNVSGRNVNPSRSPELSINNNRVLLTQNGEEIFNIEELTKQMELLMNCIYFPAFRNVINVGTRTDYFDISVGEGFIRQWNQFIGGNEPAIREKCIQIQRDLKEIFDYQALQIRGNPENNDVIVDIDDKSYRLTELGAGMAQFVLVFINAAVKQPSYILIDEPELNLHPKLQIDFISRLLKYTRNGIIFSTHSLGLAHTTAQTIYSVYKHDKYTSIIKPFDATTSFAEFLGELNFSNFSTLGLKKLLLVEGPTDVQVFHVFLRKLHKYQDVLIWPLGGSSLINKDTSLQLSELHRIGPGVQIHCWIDSEKGSSAAKLSADREAFVENCREQGINVTVSEKRAIENYFPHTIAQTINPTIVSPMQDYDQLPPTWIKGSNWRMAEKIDLTTDLADTDLKTFLESL